ncbi:hypothetical protein Dimus_025354 [Dionaea muscipula]
MNYFYALFLETFDNASSDLGISTDKIIDIRKLLMVNIETCNITNFSLSHEVRGPRLKDTVDVAAVKPCTLTLVEEDYDEAAAVAHVRRLLDIVACTTCYGPSENVKDTNKADDGKSALGAQDTAGSTSSSKKPGKVSKTKHPSNTAPTPTTVDSFGALKAKTSSGSKDDVPIVDGEGEMNNSSPKLGCFYEFFSLAHLTPPLQFIRRVSRPQVDIILADDHLFHLNVKLCNGKVVLVEACKRGFLSFGKHRILSHNLVDLLRKLSRAFDKAYDDLMRAFLERNKFGNFPYGFRANTWLIPPAAAQSPATFPPLPVEDENWGGNGGGWGRDGKNDSIPWENEFQLVASMPCKTAEEREIRDQKSFRVHSLFVDVAIFRAVSTLKHVMERTSNLNVNDEILHTERVGDLCITVMKDACLASCKVDTKIDGLWATGLEQRDLLERNLLKGITADENTVVHDIASLGSLNVRYGGYIARVKIEAKESSDICSSSPNIEVFDQPEGGANALNINSLRLLLHKGAIAEYHKSPVQLQGSVNEKSAQAFVEKLLEESLMKLQDEKAEQDNLIRWELGACWIQHLQDQKNNEKDKKPFLEKTKSEMKVRGLGTPLRSLVNKKAEGTVPPESASSKSQGNANSASVLEANIKDDELPLRRLLSDAAFAHLKDSKTGLHQKSLQELIDLCQIYYDEVALPKLVADFGSLELSPVDGRTLTDFMHTRGLRMRSLGRVVKLSEKLSHVQSLCIHEMIVRAYKHILLAVIASVGLDNMAVTVAAALNLMLGVPDAGGSHESCNVHLLVWKWLEVFLLKRYNWDLRGFGYKDLRKFVILRGLCQKVGIELIPRDYDMNSSLPFQTAEIVSLIPVYKLAACSSADARQLLESSKAALDKGKLEDAVKYGTKALAKLIAVCGPYHRMTAGAYSLLAVVLYHTGDFNQATIYQQKALDINERELGLDHPDTMKSYGDLAVFYYRLQQTELALKYVKRALYLLHLTCGPSHPNTAATYINVAMMEEGLGNVPVALRYLHKALKCNQRLLGPDHIQTAASYHAIAIALSLMEAYPLSVQHEQTTLQILRAKLGPDDLRTQDAAAWLEYFESKAFEQQEAARNGTRKPDASIASKGHLSVSDLLDYINPSHDSRGRNSAAIKRRTYTMKVRENFDQDTTQASPEGSPRDAPLLVSPQEKQIDEYENTMVEASSEDSSPVQAEEPVDEAACEKAAEKEPVNSVEVLSETHAEGEDGWQPVQRPRSASSYGRRSKLHRSSLGKGKVFGYQEKEVVAESEHTRPNNFYQDSRYYLVKKRIPSPGSYPDQPSVTRRSRIVKSVTYRFKHAPSSSNIDLKENSCRKLEAEQGLGKTSVVSLGKSPSYKEVALAQPGTISKVQAGLCAEDAEFDAGKHKDENDIAAGTETVENVEINEYSVLDAKDHMAAKIGHTERMEENQFDGLVGTTDAASTTMSSAIEVLCSDTIGIHVVTEESKRSNGDATSLNSPEVPSVDAIEQEQVEKSEVHSSESETTSISTFHAAEHPEESKQSNGDTTSLNSPEVPSVDAIEQEQVEKSEVHSSESETTSISTFHAAEHPEESKQSNGDTTSLNSPEVPSVDAIEQEQVEKSEVHSSESETTTISTFHAEEHPEGMPVLTIFSDTKDGPSKKLSASAVPFSPSPRAAPLVVNINVPSGPVAIPSASPWPLNLSLHPGLATFVPTVNPLCSPPHHAYPSRPTTPDIIQQVYFMYPPYTQAQAIPTNTFPAGIHHFHRHTYAWQHNMNPATADFVPTAIWPSVHPVEFPSVLPLGDSILDPMGETKVPPLVSESNPSISPILPVDVSDAAETKAEEIVSASKPTNEADRSALTRVENEDCKADSNSSAKVDGRTPAYDDNLKENLGSSGTNNAADHCWDESEKTFRILIRGGRNRKQTLRVPLSLLKRPYGPQSFKISYSRVVMEGETPRCISIASSGDDIAT